MTIFWLQIMDNDVKILNLLNDFIDQTRQLASSLEDDAECFKKNLVSGIEENNIKKNNINNQLHDIVKALLEIPSLAACKGTIYERLLQHAASMSVSNKNELGKLLGKMTVEITHYDKIVATNRHVLNYNLSYIKDILFALVHNKVKESSETTYDHMGALEKY